MEQLVCSVVYKGLNLEQNYRLQKNEQFQNALAAHTKATRTPMWQRAVSNGGYERCALYELKRPAPSKLQHMLESATPDLSYEETTKYKSPTYGKWKIEPKKPHFLAKYFKASGTLEFRQQNNDVVRDVKGNVEVSMPFPLSAFNGYLARYVVDLTRKGLIEAAALTPSWVRQHGIP